ncbi:PAS domain S-box protein [Aureimonas leprariae]|uniref:PAS domain S-box protein n=1 Tax=Plantimonas leprariae TaxID=2615207 RepID=UPI001386F0D8|nr:PAS domain S-box protein [Aureimonas leprariae]
MGEDERSDAAGETAGAEAARLAALAEYATLDTPPEQAFDDLAALASQICEAPVALVTLIDGGRQFFKAHVGTELEGTPIDAAICRHAFGRRDVLVIPDLAADPRTRGNPLVTGPENARFYAGAPLVTPGGHMLGTLCVIDRAARPNGLADRQLLALERLGRQVMAQLELRRALARQRAEALRNRQVLDSATEFAIVVTDRDGIVTDWSRGAEEILGWSAADMRGRSAEIFFTPEDREDGRLRKEMIYALRDGRGIDERWHVRKGDSRFWASGDMMPLRDEDDGHVGFIKIFRDRTLEHQAGVRLEETEALLRKAQEAGGVGVFSLVVADGTIEATPEFCRLFGLAGAERMPAAAIERLIVPEDRHLASNSASRLRGDAVLDVEYRIRRADSGEERWIARRGEFEADASGRPFRFVGVVRDVTEQVRGRRLLDEERALADERRNVLAAELAHRLKNTLAVVSSIATQTLRSANDLVSARSTLGERIRALSNAHDVLLSGRRDAAPIGAIVEAATTLHDGGAKRIRLRGPEIALGPKAALTLSLIVHELATNAGKYGALSSLEGQVEAEWSVLFPPAAAQPMLRFEWRESGGPPVAPPARRSFGTRLIEMGLSAAPGASAELRYEVDGLRCRIDAPLADVETEEEAPA